jgi:hypothetical protein
LLAVLALGAPLPSAIAQGFVAPDEKAFPEAECSYTLPVPGWEWLDPQLLPAPRGKTFAVARSANGLVFTLQYERLRPHERPSRSSYESFEAAFLKSGRHTKLRSTHRNFRGVPSYEFNFTMPGGQGGSALIFYANDRFYYLQVLSAQGPLGPEANVEAIFDGFNFTRPPQSALGHDFREDYERGQAVGRMFSGPLVFGGGGAVLAGIVVLVVLLTTNKSRRNRRVVRRRRWNDEYDD